MVLPLVLAHSHFFRCSVAAFPSQGAVAMAFATDILLSVRRWPPASFIAPYARHQGALKARRGGRGHICKGKVTELVWRKEGKVFGLVNALARRVGEAMELYNHATSGSGEAAKGLGHAMKDLMKLRKDWVIMQMISMGSRKMFSVAGRRYRKEAQGAKRGHKGFIT